MRWLSALSLALLPLGSFAAKKPAGDRFQEFHTQALSSAPVKLNDASFKKLTAAPRDHSVAVVLTALESRFGCEMCNRFQPEWDILGKSWTKGDKAGESRLIFGTLDFADGRDTFLSLSLQTAPVLLLYPPTTGPHATTTGSDFIRYDFSSGPPAAEEVHEWLSRHLPDRPHPPVSRPINWFRWFVTTILTLATVGVLFKARAYIIPVVQSRNLWSGVTVLGLLYATSGQVFNRIRKTPYVAAGPKGGLSYFASGFQNQFGLETQIIAFIYGVLSLATITLALRAPRTRDAKLQSAMVLVGGIVFVGMYSFLLSVFRIKNAGYPFKLPPFF